MGDAVPMSGSASIVLDCGSAGAARLHPWLDDVFRSELVPQSLKYAVRLCLEEVARNIAMHGYGPSTDGTIELSLRRLPDRVVVEVVDSAPEFDPTQAPLVPRASRLADAAPGGFGLILIRHYATEMRYQYRDGRNCLVLSFGVLT